MPDRPADLAGMPARGGVQHRFVTTPGGVRIHVAEAGPADGQPVMLVHGFPQHWWEWREQIGPLAAAGYHVLVPDLRGAGWSDAPSGPYHKAEMADDLAAVLTELDVGPVTLGAHDWGGPVAFILLLRHPQLVSGFAGFNTIAPWLTIDLPLVRHLWSFFYQYPMLAPGLGPRLLADPRGRYLRWLARWVGGGYEWSAEDTVIYLDRMRHPSRAHAGSRWYRTFQATEALSWLRGEYDCAHVEVPLRWVTGTRDPVVTPALLGGLAAHASDITFEAVPDAGHWIVEQAPELVLARLRTLLQETAR